MFDGDDLVRQAGGQAVVVIIQYRLGVFGFLSGQKIHDQGVLNAGLRNWMMACWMNAANNMILSWPAICTGVGTASRMSSSFALHKSSSLP